MKEPRTGPERILCAAIYVDTGRAEPPRRSHTYPATGIVFAGWRHGDCFTALNAWADKLSRSERKRIAEAALRGRDQGFLTSTGRYVGRAEAWRIAHAAGQLVEPSASAASRHDEPWLFSEDLY